MYGDVKVVPAAMPEADLIICQFAEDAQVRRVGVEVGDGAGLLSHMVRDRSHCQRAGQRQLAGPDHLDRDDLAGQRGLHVHDAVAIDRAVDEVPWNWVSTL